MMIATLVASLLLGAGISWVDNRPTWDDTGITVLALILASALMGLIAPKRPWLWAPAIWVSLPAWSIVKAGAVHPQMAMWLFVLVFPMAGALSGSFVRKSFAGA